MIFTHCCYCLKIHKAYPLILYLDLLRFIWITITSLLLLLLYEVAFIEFIIHSLVLFIITWQTYFDFICLSYVFRLNKQTPHQIYLALKTLFIILNFCKLLSCIDETLIKFSEPLFIIDFIWSFFDIYFAFIAHAYCTMLKKQKYGPLGASPIYLQNSSFSNLDMAVIIEMKGLKLPIQQMFKIIDKTSSKAIPARRIHKKSKKRGVNYFEIYPKEIITGKNNKFEELNVINVDLSILKEDKTGMFSKDTMILINSS